MTQTERDVIRDRHTDLNGLCGWCCCEWPCDVVALLTEMELLDAALFTADERVALIREAIVELEWGALTATDSVSREKVLDIIAATA